MRSSRAYSFGVSINHVPQRALAIIKETQVAARVIPFLFPGANEHQTYVKGGQRGERAFRGQRGVGFA